jgi:hypothetical protein
MDKNVLSKIKPNVYAKNLTKFHLIECLFLCLMWLKCLIYVSTKVVKGLADMDAKWHVYYG